MNSKKSRNRRTEEESLWLTNLEFSGRNEKNFVKCNLLVISEKIAAARKKKKISQEKLAELVQVSVATIKFIEQKQRVPSLAVLLKIIYALDKDAKLWK